jgi:hypothetical protein
VPFSKATVNSESSKKPQEGLRKNGNFKYTPWIFYLFGEARVWE